MSTTIDTRGLSCPQPVLMFLTAAKADEQGPFSVLVDNDASLENVSRAARNRAISMKKLAPMLKWKRTCRANVLISTLRNCMALMYVIASLIV